MITEFFMTIGTQMAVWFGSLFPEWEDDAVLSELPGFLSTAMGWFAGLGVWIPWAVLTACIGVQVSVTLIVFLAKIARAAAAHVPFVGGSGA